MRCSFEPGRSRHLSKVASIALLAGFSAGCSSDAMRFTDNPFSNPFERQQASYTGAISAQQPGPPYQAQAGYGYGPKSSVTAQPLPPVDGTIDAQDGYASPQPAYRPYPNGQSPLAAHAPVVTANVRGGWSSAGGATVTAQAGDSVHTLSNRYGVPAGAIMSANGLQTPSLSPGQQVIIPVFSTAAKAGPQSNALLDVPPRAAAVKPVSVKPVRVIPITVGASEKPKKPGQSLVFVQGPAPAKSGGLQPKVVKSALVTAKAEPAKPEGIAVAQAGQKGSKPVKPGAKPSAEKPVQTVPAAQPSFSSSAGAPEVADAQAAQTSADMATDMATGSAPEQVRNSPEFRWPVRGRIIQSFGQSNQGINISVPEGTEVRAAEGGVVAYVGELNKNLGNLVLVKHPGGYVTAYAHTKDFAVKPGDTIKRGQVIARAGQTGNVTSPQLHFELRKGAKPVDPREFLAGG